MQWTAAARWQARLAVLRRQRELGALRVELLEEAGAATSEQLESAQRQAATEARVRLAAGAKTRAHSHRTRSTRATPYFAYTHHGTQRRTPLGARARVRVGSGSTFADVKSARMRLIDWSTGVERCRFHPAAKGAHTALIMCRSACARGAR